MFLSNFQTAVSAPVIALGCVTSTMTSVMAVVIVQTVGMRKAATVPLITTDVMMGTVPK